MKKIATAAALLAVGLTSLSTVRAAEATQEPATVKMQATCPVMGTPINKALYVDVEGQRVYVCCGGCIAPVQKDPAKYLKVLADRGETVAKLQTKCPVSGEAVDKTHYADVQGKRIYTCCDNCAATIKADPDKYIKKLEKEGIAIDDTPKSEVKKTE